MLLTVLWMFGSVYYVIRNASRGDWLDAGLYLWLGIGAAGMWIFPRIARRILLTYFVVFELILVTYMAVDHVDRSHVGRAIVTVLLFMLVYGYSEEE